MYDEPSCHSTVFFKYLFSIIVFTTNFPNDSEKCCKILELLLLSFITDSIPFVSVYSRSIKILIRFHTFVDPSWNIYQFLQQFAFHTIYILMSNFTSTVNLLTCYAWGYALLTLKTSRYEVVTAANAFWQINAAIRCTIAAIWAMKSIVVSSSPANLESQHPRNSILWPQKKPN